MLKNYLIIAGRNLWKNKTFTFLNLGGLTISIASCLIIFFWVQDELSFDQSGTNANRVFRVALTLQANGQPDKQFAVTAGPLAPVLIKDFPEVEKAVRFEPYSTLIGYKNEHFFTDKFLFADSSFFDVFGLTLLQGNPHTALEGSSSVVLSESVAKKYFGNEDPIGKTITCNDTIPLLVTGVAKDVPSTSHFNFEMVCSFRVLEKANLDNTTNWWDDDYYTYVLLKDAKSAVAMSPRLLHIMDKYNGEENRAMGFEGLHFLQPLTSIHLTSHLSDELQANGNLTALRILIGISVFLILIACINYINLATATSFTRAKEIGVRKVSGAALGQLIGQFLTESILMSGTSLILALGVTVICLPLFNVIAGTSISIMDHFSWKLFAGLVSYAISLGVISGIYPAFYLSRIKPVQIFKNVIDTKGSLVSLRKILVVFQFTLSVLLIIATLVALQQLNFMRLTDQGFSREQVMAIPLRTQSEASRINILKKEFEKMPGISAVTASSVTPGKILGNNVILPEGGSSQHLQTMNTLVVDYDFIRAYKISMAAGRSFSPDFPTDSSAFILNEAAVRDLGWLTPASAIGKKFEWGLGKKGTVIGVVKDFHFNSLQQKVSPMVMHIMSAQSGWYGFISARVSTKNFDQILASMQDAWKHILPDHPLDYFFVDQDYNKQYQSEQRLSNLSMVFSVLTIFISCLGLFGLVMVAVRRRLKEISVRKVLGASVTNIATLLSRDFLKLVIIAIVIATPLGWIMMDKWLSGFAYRIAISGWVFALSAVIAIAIAILTISGRAVAAARTNPVHNLRS
jgi:putative ABC transport system permease protein